MCVVADRDVEAVAAGVVNDPSRAAEVSVTAQPQRASKWSVRTMKS